MRFDRAAVGACLCTMLLLHAPITGGEETRSPEKKTLPTIPSELLQLYERAIESGEKIQIPHDMLERAKEEIKRVGTWEYHVVTLRTPEDTNDIALERLLNTLGQERWECRVMPYATPPSQMRCSSFNKRSDGTVNCRLNPQEAFRVICKRPIQSYLKNVTITDLLRLIP